MEILNRSNCPTKTPNLMGGMSCFTGTGSPQRKLGDQQGGSPGLRPGLPEVHQKPLAPPESTGSTSRLVDP